MNKLLLSAALTISACFQSFSQCSVEVHDSLLVSYDYVLNTTNQTGTSPFQYNWTITDGNGMTIPYNVSAGGDSVTIDDMVLQQVYGCVIYQLCMTDVNNCTTCASDTAALTMPFGCFSQFSSNISGQNQVYVTLNSTIPPYLVMNQMAFWTDGNGQSQSMPYMNPGITIDYVPGPSSPSSNNFYLCVITSMTNGGCIHCDSVAYASLGIPAVSENQVSIQPNPANDKISISGMNSVSAYAIYSTVGELIYERTLDTPTSELSVADLTNGTYMIRLRSTEGIVTKRLTIVR